MSGACSLDGGLWPFFWMTVVICITIYALRRKP
jgi:hypothetical protein